MSLRSILVCVALVSSQVACSDRRGAEAAEHPVFEQPEQVVAIKADRSSSRRAAKPLLGDVDTSQRSALGDSLLFAVQPRVLSAATSSSLPAE